ncbi:MAG: hypothetical protein NT141_01605 [candidate division WWE3 bacterium]|nr:hypothetical protein [candidate division WWE3 bacterium]
MKLNPTTTKVLTYVVPALLAVLLVGGVSYFLGLWGPKAVTNQTDNTTQVVNKIDGAGIAVAGLKAGLPYGYKGAPQIYTAKTDNISVKVDFANPNSNENITKNLETRVYKFTKIIDGNLDLTKNAAFDEATLQKIINKTEGTFELDLYPVYSKEFKGITFGPSETKTFEASFTPTENGYYEVVIAESDYFTTGTGAKSIGFVRIGEKSALAVVTTPTTKGAATTSGTLPKTGASDMIVTVLASILGLFGVTLKSKSKK